MSSDELLRPPPEYQPDELSEQPLTFNQMFDQMIEQFAASGDDSLWMHELPNRNLTKFLEKHGGQTKKEYQSGLPKLIKKPISEAPTVLDSGEWQKYRHCLALAKQFLDKLPEISRGKFWVRVTQDQTLLKREKEHSPQNVPRMASAEFKLACSWQNYLQYTRQYAGQLDSETLAGLDILLAKANVVVARLTVDQVSSEVKKATEQQKTQLQELLNQAKECYTAAVEKANELEPKKRAAVTVAEPPKSPEINAPKVPEVPPKPALDKKTRGQLESVFQTDVRPAVVQYLEDHKPAPEAWENLQKAIQVQQKVHDKKHKTNPLEKTGADIKVAKAWVDYRTEVIGGYNGNDPVLTAGLVIEWAQAKSHLEKAKLDAAELKAKLEVGVTGRDWRSNPSISQNQAVISAKVAHKKTVDEANELYQGLLSKLLAPA